VKKLHGKGWKKSQQLDRKAANLKQQQAAERKQVLDVLERATNKLWVCNGPFSHQTVCKVWSSCSPIFVLVFWGGAIVGCGGLWFVVGGRH
jgi:hypothetical protein